MDIEEVAEKTPEKLIKRNVDPLVGLSKDEALSIVRDGGVPEDVQEGVADILVALYTVWIEEDASLAEINPLIITPERQAKALDAKVSLDESALFRHPENAGLRYTQGEDEQEKAAREKGITYVALDGDIGILGNGAGLVMSTLDVVAQAGGQPANFLDAGGGSDADKITEATQVILSNPNVKAVLFNIFGGITRCDEVANGLVEAFERLNPQVPFVVRLDGTNDAAGREILEEAALPNVHPAKTMLGAAEQVVALAKEQS
jgi:succinyl-CoA synthetase beta subunit